MTPSSAREVLHYVGYDDDAGGIVSVIRALSATGRFRCLLGLNRGAQQRRTPPLDALEFAALAGETIGLANAWRARTVAREVRLWLRGDSRRIFHGHSRAGLLVALWLHRMGEPRVVVSVHCHGSRRWFYRWAVSSLGDALFWLTPAMRAHYGLPDEGWRQCIPGGVAPSTVTPAVPESGRLRLGGIGAVVPWKHWPLVLDALAQLPDEKRRRVTFEHIGTGPAPALERLRGDASARGLGQQVIFRGSEPTSDRLLGAVDALVVASENEPFSTAMLEALAAGVPVIAADHGGATCIIQGGRNGELFRSGDAAALARCISTWLDRPPTFDRAEIRRSAMRAEDIAIRWDGVYSRFD